MQNENRNSKYFSAIYIVLDLYWVRVCILYQINIFEIGLMFLFFKKNVNFFIDINVKNEFFFIVKVLKFGVGSQYFMLFVSGFRDREQMFVGEFVVQ